MAHSSAPPSPNFCEIRAKTVKPRQSHWEPPLVVLDIPEQSASLFNGIVRQTREYGWRVIDLSITQGTILPGIHPAGLLGHGSVDHPLVQRLREQGVQAVRVGSFPHPLDGSGVPAILPDLTVGGKLAAEHFAKRQFKNVAFVGNYPWAETPYLYNAFYERARELGCACHLLQVKPHPDRNRTREEGYWHRMQQIGDWLVKLPKPVGVFTYSDLRAGTICTTAMIRGLEVPEKVALLGMGNRELHCEFSPVQLSSIDNNDRERGRQAVIHLQRLMNGESAPATPIMVPPKGVVERQSTNLLAVANPVVARALRFVWDHSNEKISLDDVAEYTAVSRSTLTRAFRKTLGRGVNAELRRKRVEHCAELLRSTEMTVADIAVTAGFGAASKLHPAFRRAYGMTPREYRYRKGREN